MMTQQRTLGWHTVVPCLLVLVLVFPALADDTPTPQPQNVALLTMRATATATAPNVRIGDIADIQGGSEQLRNRIARLDLTETPREHQSVLVSNWQVTCRIRVAGIAEDQFLLRGPTSTTVELAPTKSSDIRQTVFKPVQPEPELPVVVKQRDQVRLVAHIGPLEVKTKGEAMQDGRIGDLIRVRNIDSSVVVLGRVVERLVVEVAP